jgi:hypothetical protein
MSGRQPLEPSGAVGQGMSVLQLRITVTGFPPMSLTCYHDRQCSCLHPDALWSLVDNATCKPPRLAPAPDPLRWPFDAHTMLVVYRDEAGQVLNLKDMWLDQVYFGIVLNRGL